MSAWTELLNHYEQWRILTRSEGEAIRTGAWPQVDEYQTAKYNLQHDILAASQAADQEMGPNNPARIELDQQLRTLITELIRMEHQNVQLLAEQQSRARLELSEFDRTSRNLKSVRRAYAPQHNHAWENVS
jgi:hypothetical protein